MSDFASKYKKMGKSQAKEDKKAVTKALHQTFKMAMEGQLAGINHNGIQYLMMRQDIFNEIIKSGGRVLLTDEQKNFSKHYQVLLQIMNVLNIEDEHESNLFDEIDQFTFDFSQIMNNQGAVKERKDVLEKFNNFIESDELLVAMKKSFWEQMYPDETKKPENEGKLT